MKTVIYFLPLVLFIGMTSCSEDAQKEVKTEKKEPLKPLVERDPEVKDYFESMNEMIDEYIVVGETVLTTLEKLDSGKLGYLETAATVQGLLENWQTIDTLQVRINAQEDLKGLIEERLNPKDLAEFAAMYTKTQSRFNEFLMRLEGSDLKKYIGME